MMRQAGVSAGLFPDLIAGISEMVHEVEMFEPSAHHAVYEQRYQRFIQACSWMDDQYGSEGEA